MGPLVTRRFKVLVTQELSNVRFGGHINNGCGGHIERLADLLVTWI